jgi:hypothetical protein
MGFHRRAGNWPVYAAATGSALAMATGASASILYSGAQNVSVTAPLNGNAIQPLGLDGSGHVLNLKAGAGHSITTSGFSSRFGAVSVQAVNQVQIFVGSNTQLVKNFLSGQMISSFAGGLKANAEIVNKGFLNDMGLSTFGGFQAGVPGFAGLAIQLGTGTEYGWIRLEFVAGASGLPKTLTAIDWAIQQTPGIAIAAGQTTDVAGTPEPGTMALALLASGAAGIMAWKRCRKTSLTAAS